ncbi:MAG TPA: ATPase [Gammaproteobacteria bacterium]|nr:ATPase [Candidatus Competibacteraceae bacterium]HCB13311.1 ATPase [Gammaproteobacteria bacterium]HRE54358.1 ATP-binding protein [Candidatus Competibacter sp.]HUM94490.1 ATP-binding protein [Candidatus Competibacter sp.]
MYPRFAQQQLVDLLAQFPAVVLLGPRQAGKTTLALAEMAKRGDALYLDLELPSAQRQLDDPEGFLLAQRHRLVILDEVQRIPELFTVLRGVIDIRRRDGETAGQFLLLGSASGALLQQASESLAGRVARLELTPFEAREVLPPTALGVDLHPLWVRGGFPLSWLAPDDAASLRWREAFIATYLERDIPTLGPRIPATTLRRLWIMLAHVQGGLLNQSQLAASLAVSGQTVARYIDILADLMLVRRLPAWHGNVGKRLVRAPKVYVRDSGIVHALLGLTSLEAVLGHPVAGVSWEGFVIEQLLAAAPQAEASFYRTSHGAEADLVLGFRNGETWVVEIKLASAPTVSRGFHQAAADVGAIRKLLVAPVAEPYPMRDGVDAMNPLAAAAQVAAQP